MSYTAAQGDLARFPITPESANTLLRILQSVINSLPWTGFPEVRPM